MASTKSNTDPAEKPKGDPADVKPATSFAPSGAPEQDVPGVDVGHPALDANPRAGTTADQNRIDLNDPTLSGAEAVKRNLEAQKPAAEEKAEKPAE
ncbi:hypothetical protein [Methylobacterium platani]|uniref:Uncharacterized protein n=1 Tax=Methylobacterium platani TaxID=427683 RepID=A0A179SHD3_9HYPH|nr:hypothetical protein [Methylobacterium platani]OAS26291.1 hypothetical protein A5481_06120 [Methylobacterium platani]